MNVGFCVPFPAVPNLPFVSRLQNGPRPIGGRFGWPHPPKKGKVCAHHAPNFLSTSRSLPSSLHAPSSHPDCSMQRTEFSTQPEYRTSRSALTSSSQRTPSSVCSVTSLDPWPPHRGQPRHVTTTPTTWRLVDLGCLRWLVGLARLGLVGLPAA